MERGWIKLYRKSMDNDLYFAETFTRWQAWLDLILIANHKPGKIIIRGNEITVPRGTVGYSQPRLSTRWKWSRGKINRFLNRLESEHKIVQHKNNLTTLIHIVNYSTYQAGNTTDDTPGGPQTSTNKKGKKGKKKPYGEFYNVLLTDLELKKLREKFHGTTENRIEILSAYMTSKGRKYKDHYATILNWSRNEQNNSSSGQSAAAKTMRELRAKLK